MATLFRAWATPATACSAPGTEGGPMELMHAFALALLLGMQHGLDPDHLAAIDGLILKYVTTNQSLYL